VTGIQPGKKRLSGETPRNGPQRRNDDLVSGIEPATSNEIKGVTVEAVSRLGKSRETHQYLSRVFNDKRPTLEIHKRALSATGINWSVEGGNGAIRRN
jgi:hypothetical protein